MFKCIFLKMTKILSRNGLLSRTLIRPYFDKEFSVKEFVKGAKECLISTFILDPLQAPSKNEKSLVDVLVIQLMVFQFEEHFI